MSLAALACQESNTIAGPNVPATPTPTAPAVAIAGDWVGIYQADPKICQTFNLAAATATFTENGTALSGDLTATQGNCPTAVHIQAIRSGNTFSGTATQLGYTGTVTGAPRRDVPRHPGVGALERNEQRPERNGAAASAVDTWTRASQ